MNDVCRFSRDHVVECSERTVLSCLELAKCEVKCGIFARRAMVDQAREGLCYQRINLTFLICLT